MSPSEEAIALRVAALAKKIARAPLLPDIAMPILVGGIIFAADLVRALSRQGVDLDIEMLWLRSYGDKRKPQGEVRVLIGPGENIRGRHVLLGYANDSAGLSALAGLDSAHEGDVV